MTTRSPEAADPEPAGGLKPRLQVRRFDVFAEYNKLEELKKGRPLAEAKGHGLWVAKVVAARRFGAGKSKTHHDGERKREGEAERPEAEGPFRTLGGERQTDALFDREIVDRMGRRFYDEVFAPTIARHFERGDRYEAIRDAVRKDWKPTP